MAPPTTGGRGPNASANLVVELIPGGREQVARRGPVGSVHEAELVTAPEAVGPLLTTGFVRRAAGAYWRYLGRISLGLLRVRSEPGHQSLVLLLPGAALLRFGPPRYRDGPDWAEVEWGIDRGLLVAAEGRGRGSLRTRVQRVTNGDRAGTARLRVRMEVDGYYPRCRGRGWFAPLGTWIYGRTQARIHRLVMRGFLRSLAGLGPTSGAAEAVARLAEDSQ